jgi:hypothetical protein
MCILGTNRYVEVTLDDTYEMWVKLGAKRTFGEFCDCVVGLGYSIV